MRTRGSVCLYQEGNYSLFRSAQEWLELLYSCPAGCAEAAVTALADELFSTESQQRRHRLPPPDSKQWLIIHFKRRKKPYLLFLAVTNEHEMQFIDFKYVTSLFFFLLLFLLKAQHGQKLNALPFSLTCSRFNIWLHNLILQTAAWQLSDPSRYLLRTFLPEECSFYLVFQILFLGVLLVEFHYVPV